MAIPIACMRNAADYGNDIMSAIDSLPKSGGEVHVNGGQYWITDANKIIFTTQHSYVTVRCSEGVEIIGSNGLSSDVVAISGAFNVVWDGGTINGNSDNNISTNIGSRACFKIFNRSTNVTLKNAHLISGVSWCLYSQVSGIDGYVNISNVTAEHAGQDVMVLCGQNGSVDGKYFLDNVKLKRSLSNDGLVLYAAKNSTFNNIHIDGDGTSSGAGVVIDSNHGETYNLRLSNVMVTRYKKHGFLFGDNLLGGSKTVGPILLSNCIAERNGWNGFIIRDYENVSLQNCSAINNGYLTSSGCGVLVESGTNISINGGIYSNISGTWYGDSTGSQAYGIRSVGLSDYIIVTGVQARGNTVSGISLVGTNSVIQNNIVETT